MTRGRSGGVQERRTGMSDTADQDKAGERRGPRWRLACSAAIVGLVSLLLGLPQLVAGFHLNPYDSVLTELAQGKPVPPSLIERTAASREASLGWLRGGTQMSELATLRVTTLATLPVFSPERRRLAAEAVDFQAGALALAPGDGYGWTRYLQTLAISAAPVADVEKVLDEAISRARTDPALVLVRLRVAALYWRGLSAAMRERLAGQIILAATWSPTALARIARARQLDDVFAAILATNPIALARYNYVRTRIGPVGG
ncbi:MAG: hypothetical protein RL477_1682 [Pseudomonadota bacterium]|jgi:hypothetical protein